MFLKKNIASKITLKNEKQQKPINVLNHELFLHKL